MTYPSRAELLPTLILGGYDLAKRRFGLTEAETHDIDIYGRVREATRIWADDLRARFPEAFQ